LPDDHHHQSRCETSTHRSEHETPRDFGTAAATVPHPIAGYVSPDPDGIGRADCRTRQCGDGCSRWQYFLYRSKKRHDTRHTKRHERQKSWSCPNSRSVFRKIDPWGEGRKGRNPSGDSDDQEELSEFVGVKRVAVMKLAVGEAWSSFRLTLFTNSGFRRFLFG